MLCREVTAKGVSLSGAEVGGKLSFDRAKLHQLILSGAHVGGLAVIRRGEASPGPDRRRAAGRPKHVLPGGVSPPEAR